MDADRPAGIGVDADRVHCLLDPVERLANLGQQGATRGGQRQRLTGAVEKLVSQQFLKTDDMAADRALRDVERLRPRRETQALADGVERTQRVQWQPATINR